MINSKMVMAYSVERGNFFDRYNLYQYKRVVDAITCVALGVIVIGGLGLGHVINIGWVPSLVVLLTGVSSIGGTVYFYQRYFKKYDD